MKKGKLKLKRIFAFILIFALAFSYTIINIDASNDLTPNPGGPIPPSNPKEGGLITFGSTQGYGVRVYVIHQAGGINAPQGTMPTLAAGPIDILETGIVNKHKASSVYMYSSSQTVKFNVTSGNTYHASSKLSEVVAGLKHFYISDLAALKDSDPPYGGLNPFISQRNSFAGSGKKNVIETTLRGGFTNIDTILEGAVNDCKNVSRDFFKKGEACWLTMEKIYNVAFGGGYPDNFDPSEYYLAFEPIYLFAFGANGGSQYESYYGTLTELSQIEPHYKAQFDSPYGLKGWGCFTSSDVADRPKYLSGSSSSCYTAEPISNTDPRGVAHIWLGKYTMDTCENMVNKIGEKYGINTTEYDEEIKKLHVSPETYKFIDKNGEEIWISSETEQQKARDAKNLEKENYKDKPATCDSPEIIVKECEPDGIVNIDKCTSGKNEVSDTKNQDDWLECGLAYSINGVGYSSENTGHDSIYNMAQGSEKVYYASKWGNGDASSQKVGNETYCKLFCTEELKTEFPTEPPITKAGQKFSWALPSGSSTYGKVSIRKLCKNQEFNPSKGRGFLFPQWLEVFKNNQETTDKEWLRKGANEWSYEEKNISTTSGTCCYTPCSHTCTFGSGKNKTTGPCHACDKWGTYVSAQGHGTTVTQPGFNTWTTTSTSYSSKVVTLSGSSYDKSGYSCDLTYAAAYKNAVGQVQSYYAEQYQQAEENARTAGSNEPKLLVQIMECISSIAYKYVTTVQLHFKEPVSMVYGANSRNFTYDGGISGDPGNGVNPEEDNMKKYNAHYGGCKSVQVHQLTCIGKQKNAKCNQSTTTVYDCSNNSLYWLMEGEWTYSYKPSTFEWYSFKTNGDYSNEASGVMDNGDSDVKELIDSMLSDDYYYELGYGFPTAINLADGIYGGGRSSKSPMYVEVNKLGDAGSIPPQSDYSPSQAENGHLAPLMQLIDGDDKSATDYGFAYACTYEVENDFFGYECEYVGKTVTGSSPDYCDDDKDDTPEGEVNNIDIVYRLVSLLEPGSSSIAPAFQKPDGSSRYPKTNWSILSNAEILEILRSDIYEEPAMYEIYLDVNAINAIRLDNNQYTNAGLDPYTSFFDASNAQKVYCKKGSDSHDAISVCTSSFISDLMGGSAGGKGLNYRLEGTCLPVQDTEQRAEHILNSGCDNNYNGVYNHDWTR